MPFPPSAACRFFDLPPVNLQNLPLHLTKNSFASAPTHLCGIALDTDGKVKRQLPIELDRLIQELKIHTADQRLNELIQQATEDIRKPELKDRTYALEKLWDAFERMKTFYSSNKSSSANQVFQKAASATADFEKILIKESSCLTDIGNDYQIRHFETNKKQITSLKQVDYLYYRMLSLISLCIEQL